MASVNTNDLRIQNARNLVKSIVDSRNSYVFIGRPMPWENDNDPPVPTNNIQEYYETMDQILSMQRITGDDVKFVVLRSSWLSGVTYDIYRHDYSKRNPSFSGVSNLYDARFVVINRTNNVYVCLDNNKNSPSLVEPLSDGDEPFYTSDGYQWMKIYKVGVNYFTGSPLDVFIPVDEVSPVRTVGCINTTIIESGGQGFTINPVGGPNQIPFYYCNVTGDGTGAVAKLVVSGGKVTKIEMSREGEGYTYAQLLFNSNNAYATLDDLDNDRNSLNPLGDGTFDATPIITPQGGWGSDNVRHLGATRISVYSNLKYNMSDFINNCTFRQIGILQGVDTGNALPNGLSGHFAAKMKLTPLEYEVGETIIQKFDANTTARGYVVGWDPDTLILRYIQDPVYHSDTDGVMVRFSNALPIIGLTSAKNGSVESDFDNPSGGLDFNNGLADPEFDKTEGMMTYLSNVSPVVRDESQSERINLIISF